VWWQDREKQWVISLFFYFFIFPTPQVFSYLNNNRLGYSRERENESICAQHETGSFPLLPCRHKITITPTFSSRNITQNTNKHNVDLSK
jgi:hypothetical protein